MIESGGEKIICPGCGRDYGQRAGGHEAEAHDGDDGDGVGSACDDASAVENDGMVQQRALAIGCGAEFLQEIGEHPDVERIDLGHLVNPLGAVLVVGERVVRVGNANLAVGTLGLLAAHHEGDDASHIGLVGQRLQVEH